MAHRTPLKHQGIFTVPRQSGVISSSITQFRQKSYAMYNPLTSYSNSHNQDCGSDSKRRGFYSEVKYRSSDIERPHKPRVFDKTLLKAAHQFVAAAPNAARLNPNQLNRPLEFTPDKFKTKTFYDSHVPVSSKSSPANIGWIKQEASRNHMQRVSRGEYIPSIAHLDIYGRRKEPTKFEQYGLWIAKNPLTQF